MPNQPGIHKSQQAGRRDTYLDGLLELVIGVLLFIVALATGRPAFYWTYLVAILILGPGLQRLKARYTYPRIGYVRFPDEDPKRFRKGVATVDGPYGNLRVWAILMAVLSLTTGAGVLRRFLRDHPVIEDRMPDAN